MPPNGDWIFFPRYLFIFTSSSGKNGLAPALWLQRAGQAVGMLSGHPPAREGRLRALCWEHTHLACDSS